MKDKDKNILSFFVPSCSSDNVNAIIKKLDPHFNILRTNNLKDYKSYLKKEIIDCVVVCFSDRDEKIIKAVSNEFLNFPHIFVINKNLREETQKLLSSGLKDYIVNNHVSRLLPAVNREIASFENRKKTKIILERLKKSEKTLNTYFEEAPLATISWDLNFKVIKWNNAAVTMFGYTAAEAIGKSCLELMAPKGLENKAKELFKNLLNQKGKTENVNETLTKRGNIKICLWHNTILKGKNGKTAGVISAIEDITDKRKIHNKILRSQQLLKQSQKLSEVYFLDISLDTNTIILDENFVKLSGLPPQKQYKAKKVLNDLIYPKDRKKLLRAFSEALKNKKKLAIDIRIVYASGAIHWVNILADILEDKVTHKKSYLGTFINISERKKEILQLQEQKKRLNLSIDIAQIGFIDWDFESDVVKFSEKARQIFDLDIKQETFQSKDIISKLHPNDILKAKSALNLIKTKKKPYSLNYRLLRATGETIWVNALGEVAYDRENKSSKMISIVRDITKQVTRERRLLQHSLILNQINSLVLVLDENMEFVFSSSSVVKITGYSIEEVLGQGWWDVSYVSESEKINSRNHFKSILEETKVINNLKYERKVLCKDGSIKWFSWQFSRGTEGSIISLAHDITKEKEKEYLVIKLFKAIEKSPTIVVITDVNGCIEYVNPKFEEVTGYASKEVIGQNPGILNSGITSPKEHKNFWDTVSKGETWRGEFKNKKKDGSEFWERAIITPVKNNEGVVTNYIALKEDITETRGQEKKFLYALFEAQEKEKLKFGEELHDSLSQILSAMSFYLEAVLNPKNKKDHLKVEYLEKVRELSADALRESRHISHGLMSKQLLKGGLISAINEICTNYNVSRNIKFTFSHKDYKEGLLDDQTIQNIYRVTQEITTNIIRHAAAAKASIKITIENNEWFVLEIEDDGIGIDSKIVKEKSKSFGLKNIQQRISLLNGQVIRKTEINKGTKYHIKIPIV